MNNTRFKQKFSELSFEERCRRVDVAHERRGSEEHRLIQQALSSKERLKRKATKLKGLKNYLIKMRVKS